MDRNDVNRTEAATDVDAPQDAELHARREFLKKAGKVAATAPALALILRAKSVQARGYNHYGPKPEEKPSVRDWRHRR